MLLQDIVYDSVKDVRQIHIGFHINAKINGPLQFILGSVDESTVLNDQNESKSDRRKSLARECYAAVSPRKRAMIKKMRFIQGAFIHANVKIQFNTTKHH
jgi:hypothetical protein